MPHKDYYCFFCRQDLHKHGWWLRSIFLQREMLKLQVLVQNINIFSDSLFFVVCASPCCLIPGLDNRQTSAQCFSRATAENS